MSTRRARIKAVTSLPPRRKNADKGSKDIKSESESDSKQKVRKTSIDLTETENISQSIADKSGDKHNTQEETSQRIKVIDEKKSPKAKVTNAVSAIRSNVFVSPQRKSPRKTFATPVAPSPKITKNQDAFKSIQKSGSTPVTQKINDCDELQISNSIINKVQYTDDSKKKDKTGKSAKTDTDEEAVMDGIVPLQPESHAPIDILKNDIPENAEALFDPIIPLPSPGKVRPKLRPVPRLGPLRRNSIQGSASESEDESRRLVSVRPNTPAPRQRYDSHTSISTLQSLPNRDVSRVRNDSICSTTSQVTTAPTVVSPLKEKPCSKTRRLEATQRNKASKRRREAAKREVLTMYDLIFYNPPTNPIVPDEDELKAIEENEKDMKEINEKKQKEEESPRPTPEDEDSTPVPQIKLGPNGEIMLDESSLVIKRTESKRELEGKVVREGAWRAGGGRYRRMPRTAEWEAAETVRFYRALGALGTDFTLMAPLFPNRTRKELKLKFKKEERFNGAQVDKALRSATGFDIERLSDEFRKERELAAQEELKERTRMEAQRRAEKERIKVARSSRTRTSRGMKAIEIENTPGVKEQIANGVVTANGFIDKVRRRKRELDPEPPTPVPVDSNLATLTLIQKQRNNNTPNQDVTIPRPGSTLTVVDSDQPEMPNMPSNIETGSLVVLTVDDPSSPGKKMLQTYIANGPHKLTPVALPATFLNSVVGYMKKNSAKGSSRASSPLLSPASVSSQDSRNSASGNGAQSPMPRKRTRSYNITNL